MGGSRCFYRNCKVNGYKHPQMHFFRFPLKDKARCNLWVTYSQQNDFDQRTLERQKNLTICGRHFRDECFMNYKKDRLVATAVPSIHRLSQDQALDYEPEMNNGVLVTLPETAQPHLIAPAGYECPLGFGFDAEVSELLRSVENNRNADHSGLDGEVPEPSTNNSNLISTNSVELVDTIEIPAGKKRPANCLLTDKTISDEGNEAAKRSRNNNLAVDDSSSNTDDIIVISAAFDNNSQPTIINHQIMDAESRLWLQSETISLQDGSGYQFVEVQSQSEQSETEQIHEIGEQLLEENVDEDNLSLTEDLHISHKLEAVSIENNDLRTQLKEEMQKVKKLECKLSASRMACKRSEQQVASLRVEVTGLQNANEDLEAKYMEAEILKLQMQDEKEERTKLEKELSNSKQECARTKKQIVALNALLVKAKGENDDLKSGTQILAEKETMLRQEYDEQLQTQQSKHLQIEQQLQQQISNLEHRVELAGKELNNISSLKTEDLNSCQKVLLLETQLQKMQELYDDKGAQHRKLENNYESLQKSNEKLKTDYKMLECNQHQVSTVTTSNSNRTISLVVPHQQSAAISAVTALTKSQLFNGVKRYISSSMCSLLRMEMFGSSEREWKPDERQVAVDLLRLGESVYNYATDEWRFRLPALRDVRNWLNQSAAMDDEEDL